MKLSAFVVALLAILPFCARAAGDPAAAASAWLAEVDAGDYSASWNDAGKLFQDKITQAKWSEAVKGARGPLGEVALRAAPKVTKADKLPGAPDGHYAVLSFATRFAKEADATETVVLAEQGAGWKVVGYFIR